MNYNRGDIVLVLFPDSNLQTSKRRPALVVQADGLATRLPQAVVALISSNMARVGPSFRVAVPKTSALGRGSGLQSDSVILLDNLATVLHQLIDRKIGVLSDMTAVDAAIRIALSV